MEDTAPIAEAPVESPVESQVESTGGSEAPAAPEKFRVWDHDKEEAPKEPASIPYSRFREVNEERKAYQDQLKAYEDRLAQYTAREAELASIKSPEDLNPNDYDSPQAYIQAMQKATKEQTVREVEQRFVNRQQEAAQAQYVEALTQNYYKNLNESVARNPEIKEAVSWLDKYAKHIHPEIAHELMIDENVGELVYDITTDKALLTKMFQGNPKDFIRDLHKMSAKIDRATRYAPKEGDGIPAAPEKYIPISRRSEIAGAIPAQVKSSTRGSKSIYSMSTNEYKAWKASQK